MRPDGPVRIKSTKMVDKDVLIAQLGGSVRTTVATIRHRGKYYFKEKGKQPIELPADSLTDCLHYAIESRDIGTPKSQKEQKVKKRTPAKSKKGSC